MTPRSVIWMLSLITSGCSRETTSTARFFTVAWRSDAELVVASTTEAVAHDVYESDCSRRTVFVLDLVSGEREVILTGSQWCRLFGEGQLVGSTPNATDLFFVTGDDSENHRLVRWNTAAGDTTTVVDGCVRARITVAIHPSNGNLIVPMDCSAVHRRERLFIVTPRGARIPVFAARSGLPEGEPNWHPAEPRIAFVRESARASVHSEVVVADLKTHREHTLGFGASPAFSPDGRHLAYIGLEQSMNSQPVVVTLDQASGGSTRTALPVEGAFPQGPLVWALDSSGFVVAMQGPEGSTLWTFMLKTGEFTQLYAARQQ
jgi:hypothetical protein